MRMLRALRRLFARTIIRDARRREREVVRSLNRLQRRTAGSIPNDIAIRVAHIANAIRVALPRATPRDIGPHARHVLVACATDYLPTALHAYLAVPRVFADREKVADGKTLHVLLREQLDLLVSEIDAIVESVNRADSARLVVHGRFLEEKFARSGLDVPRGSSAAG